MDEVGATPGDEAPAGPVSPAGAPTGPDVGSAEGVLGQLVEERIPPVPSSLALVAGWSWRALVVGAAVYFALQILTRLSVVVLPLIIATILATLCVPVAAWLRRRGLPRAAAAGITVVGGITLIVLLLVALAPSFVDQIEQLRPAVEDGIEALLGALDDFGFDQNRLSELLGQAQDALSGSASTILSGVATGAGAVISFVTGLALLVVMLFFFVKDADEITGWLVARTPEAHRELVVALGRRAWDALSGYVRGTAAIAAIDATAIGIGLAIIGVPLVLPLSVIVFLGAFLPVVGALLAGLIAVLVALAAGDLGTAVATLVLIIAVQQVEGNVLQPLIMRRAVALHPVVVLTALAIGATLAGIVGAFLSLPVAAVLSAVGNELRLRSEPDGAAGRPTAEPVTGTSG